MGPLDMPPAFRRAECWLIPLVFSALLVRLVQLDTPALRWDEGWSLAQASLRWPALLQVAAEDWHPPLYAILLRLWLATGKSVFSLRYLSVLLGILAVPLTYRVARSWVPEPPVAVGAAFFAALLPMLVYYGQVARMYPLATLLVLGAALCLERGARRSARSYDLGLAFTSAAGMATLYQTFWPLAGLYLYGVLSHPRRLPRLLLSGAAALALYVPWLVYAGTTIQARMSAGSTFVFQSLRDSLRYLGPALYGLAFAYGSGWPAVTALVLTLVAGVALRLFRREGGRFLWLPLLVIGPAVLGIAYVSQASHWFAPRHLVPAVPFLGLALAWALEGLRRRWWPFAPAALAALAIAYWPTCTGFVYAKTLEVVNPFDPAADYRFLSQHAGPDDLVYFNVLSKAGWYENLRQPDDPAWSYAMRWEPIVEPMPRLAQRIARDATRYQRLWFVLYQGTYGTNGALKEWLDARYFPAAGEWQGDTLYLSYVVPGKVWSEVQRDDRFGPSIRLVRVRFTPDLVPGGAFAVALCWDTSTAVEADYNVFVHLTDDTGKPVAQHDSPPAGGESPTHTWQPGQPVWDRHGLFLPQEMPQRLRLRIGLYDPATGQRLRLANGSDQVEIAVLGVAPPGLSEPPYDSIPHSD